MAAMLSSSLLCLILLMRTVSSLPEQGAWVVNINEDNQIKAFSKTMFKDTQISVSVKCEADADIAVSWMLRRSPCAGEFTGVTGGTKARFFQRLDLAALKLLPYSEFQYLKRDNEILKCTPGSQVVLEPLKYDKPEVVKEPEPVTPQKSDTKASGEDKTGQKSPAAVNGDKKQVDAAATPNANADKAVAAEGNKKEEPAKTDTAAADGGNKGEGAKAGSEDNQGAGAAENAGKAVRRRRAAETDVQAGAKVPQQPPTKNQSDLLEKGSDSSKLDHNTLVKVWEDGYYLFILSFEAASDDALKLEVTVRMSQGDSYISAGDWPLLIFYGVMGLVYVFYGIFWLVMLACNWRDLLRVQFWISAVILLGMLEKAVFFGEYENVNKTGQSVHGAVIFAELVSCVKRTLARMLVIIVSLGYGIVKPRLGQTFHKVVIVGGIFFILASLEACLRANADKAEQSKSQMIASVPLAVTEAIICWWIFTSLLQTMRTLRLRRNVVKLSLYRHFTNTLIFSIIASIAYMVWFLTQHRFTPCITDWKELWMDEAYWHLLFSVILFIIMILWRPTANNQRYAFSPLLDAAEDDVEDDIALNDAFDGMKMRGTKPQQRNGSPGVRDEQKAEDDLKWVDENIPSSIVDKMLPALDSDEEIMNTKFETSKME